MHGEGGGGGFRPKEKKGGEGSGQKEKKYHYNRNYGTKINGIHDIHTHTQQDERNGTGVSGWEDVRASLPAHACALVPGRREHVYAMWQTMIQIRHIIFRVVVFNLLLSFLRNKENR